MFEEEHPLPGPKTVGEKFAFWHLIAVGIAAAWLLGGSSALAAPFLMTACFFAPVLVIIHWVRGDFHKEDKPSHYKYYWLVLIYSLAVFIAGLFFPIFKEVSAYGKELLVVQQQSAMVPINPNWKIGLWSMLLSFSLLIAALNIRFVIRERWVQRHLLLLLGLNAVVLALFGLSMRLFDAKEIYGFFDSPNPDFFATFIHPAHWSAFAFLWVVALSALTAFYKRRRHWLQFLRTPGILCLLGAGILVWSILIQEQKIYTIATGAYLSLCLLASGVLGMRRTKTMVSGIAHIMLAASLVAGTFYASSQVKEDLEQPRNSENMPYIVKDSLDIFQQYPLFGWGESSFPLAFSLYREADINAPTLAHPGSSYLLSLVERGLIGTVVWTLAALGLFLGILKGRGIRSITGYLLLGLAFIIPIGAIDFPFASPAFTLSFWILLATAVRWAQTEPRIAFTPKPTT